MYLIPSIVPTREPISPPKIRKYRVMVIAGGIRVWPQMRMIRLTSRRTMVPSATRFCCMAVGWLMPLLLLPCR